METFQFQFSVLRRKNDICSYNDSQIHLECEVHLHYTCFLLSNLTAVRTDVFCSSLFSFRLQDLDLVLAQSFRCRGCVELFRVWQGFLPTKGHCRAVLQLLLLLQPQWSYLRCCSLADARPHLEHVLWDRLRKHLEESVTAIISKDSATSGVALSLTL